MVNAALCVEVIWLAGMCTAIIQGWISFNLCSFSLPAEALLEMTPTQVAALEQFLTNNDFDYYDYDEEAGVVLYNSSMGDWTMEVAYGDECYYRLYNEVTEMSNCNEFTKVSELMTQYDKLYWLNHQLLEA